MQQNDTLADGYAQASIVAELLESDADCGAADAAGMIQISRRYHIHPQVSVLTEHV